VRERGFRLGLELVEDRLGEHLSKLDAPLVERVDPPDDALSEDAVLDETMKRVSAGSRSRVASVKSVPSTFETKRNVSSRSL